MEVLAFRAFQTVYMTALKDNVFASQDILRLVVNALLTHQAAHKVLLGIHQQTLADATYKDTILSIMFALLVLLTHSGTETFVNVILITL